MRGAHRHDDSRVCCRGDYRPTQYLPADPPQEGDDECDDEDSGKDSSKGGYFLHVARSLTSSLNEFSQPLVNQPLQFRAVRLFDSAGGAFHGI